MGVELPKRTKNSSLQTSDSVTVTVPHNNAEAVATLVGELNDSLAARIVHLEAQPIKTTALCGY